MPTLRVAFNNETYVASVLEDADAIPTDSTVVGSFSHPDETYPNSYVIFHGVRDILYKRSLIDPTVEGFWPNNITDMASVFISTEAELALTGISVNPTSVTMTLNSTSQTTGQNVTFTAVPAAASISALAITTAPISSIATASLSNGVLNVKAVGVGSTSAVLYCNEIGKTVNIVVNAPSLTGITATPSTISMSVATDAASGKNVEFAAVPALATLGTLSIKTAPAGATATATIASNVLTVKPVAEGTTSVVVTSGAVDVTIAITVTA